MEIFQSDPDNLNGYLNLKDFAFSDTKEVYPVQEVNLKAFHCRFYQIIFNSQIADVELKGKYKLTQIFGALSNTINQYYQFQKPGKHRKFIQDSFSPSMQKLKMMI
jgi:hypothetical protein